jgi:hypothetical protein
MARFVRLVPTTDFRLRLVMATRRTCLYVFTEAERAALTLSLLPHKSQNYCFCGMSVTAVGPIAVNCTITSPSFAQT